jgi:hypothetical protein
MNIKWIIIETLAVLVENSIEVYFLNSQLQNRKKYRFSLPIMLWLADTYSIDVSAQSSFPESGDIRVSDGDLRSLV